jgi:predicted DNA-binding protein (MmcQ/YjbR family)
LIVRALTFAGAVEDYPFGEDLLTVKVGGKVFAWIPLSDAGWLGQGPRMAVKLPVGLVTELHHAYPGQVGPARPLDQRYWVTISLAANIPGSEICELLALSYHEVVARLPRNRRPTPGAPVDSVPATGLLPAVESPFSGASAGVHPVLLP